LSLLWTGHDSLVILDLWSFVIRPSQRNSTISSRTSLLDPFLLLAAENAEDSADGEDETEEDGSSDDDDHDHQYDDPSSDDGDDPPADDGNADGQRHRAANQPPAENAMAPADADLGLEDVTSYADGGYYIPPY